MFNINAGLEELEIPDELPLAPPVTNTQKLPNLDDALVKIALDTEQALDSFVYM